jgi:hypothetical protein
LNDAMDIVWDDATDSLEAVQENIRQAKDRLDDAVRSSKMRGPYDGIAVSTVEEASKLLGTTLYLLKEYLEPMEDEEDEEPEPKPEKKATGKKPAAKKKAKK